MKIGEPRIPSKQCSVCPRSQSSVLRLACWWRVRIPENHLRRLLKLALPSELSIGLLWWKSCCTDRKLYNFNFTEDDQRNLATLLQSIKGKFVLSIDDVPQIRELYRDSNISEIELPYTAQREAGKRFQELIITNF